MEEIINNICAVHYARIDEVSDFIVSPTGAVQVTAPWQLLSSASGSLLTIRERIGKAGRSFETDFSTTLKNMELQKNLLLIRITLNNGRELLIGDRDLPVRLLEDHTLTSKTLTFSHSSWHYPFVIV